MFKRFSALLITALFIISAVAGQSGNAEMSIEESYLQEEIEMMIIRANSKSDDRNQKMVAINYIANALERGSTNEELRTILEYLSLEGTLNKVTRGGRLANDFPEVRRQAAKYLGVVGTKEAKSALIKICSSDREPMVLQEAIKSLGDVGMNDHNDAVNMIVWITNRYNNSRLPDDLLTLVAVDTLERLGKKYEAADTQTLELLAKIAEGPYTPPVRDRAKQAHRDLLKYAPSGEEKKEK